MKTYIAWLRGINVSGQKKIKMADLRKYLGELAYENLQTYIQSGNIIFQVPENPANATLEAAISGKIKEKYGWDVPTAVISLEELETVIREVPYGPEFLTEGNKFYVTFLEAVPTEENVEALEVYSDVDESFKWIEKRIYIHLPHGAARTKLNNNTIERKLKMNGTTRNWKTVNKMVELGREMETN